MGSGASVGDEPTIADKMDLNSRGVRNDSSSRSDDREVDTDETRRKRGEEEELRRYSSSSNDDDGKRVGDGEGEIASKEKTRGELLREKLRSEHPGHDETNEIESMCVRAATRRSRAIEEARRKLLSIDLDTSAMEKAAIEPLRRELKALQNEEEEETLDLQQYAYDEYAADGQYGY